MTLLLDDQSNLQQIQWNYIAFEMMKAQRGLKTTEQDIAHIKEISHVFMVLGHSHMEVDSMHASIES